MIASFPALRQRNDQNSHKFYVSGVGQANRVGGVRSINGEVIYIAFKIRDVDVSYVGGGDVAYARVLT